MDFKAVKELARGGMSVLYEGFSESLGRSVVLKRIHPALASDPLYLGRAEQESRILSGLDHPGIVGFLGAWTTSGPLPVIGGDPLPSGSFLLMLEKSDGDTLEKIVVREGPVPVERAIFLFGRICDSLAYLHERKICHFDINPSNILTRRDGEPVLADFGLSLFHGDTGRTLPHEIRPATPAFLSPEQAAGIPGDARSDLFALGMTFFYLLEGRGYFENETPSGIWRRLVYDTAPFELQFSRPVPDHFREILQRLVARNSGERYPDAGVLLRAWKNSRGPAPQAAGNADLHSSGKGQIPAPGRYTGRAALLMAGILFILGVIWLSERPMPPVRTSSPVPPSATAVDSRMQEKEKDLSSGAPELLPPVLPVHTGTSDLIREGENQPEEDSGIPE